MRAMIDGLVAVIGVACKLLLSDDIYMGRVSSNGSIPGLDGKISTDPQHFTNRDLRVCGQFVHYGLGVQHLGLRYLIQSA